MRDVLLLGSTGSIGTQSLDVIRRNPDRFNVVGLAAGGDRAELLAAQALEFGVEVVAVAKATAAQDLQLAFYAEAQRRGYSSGEFAIPKIVAGPEAVAEVAGWSPAAPAASAAPASDGAASDGAEVSTIVVNGIDGARGIAATLAALAAGHTLVLANKESLILGGSLVTNAAKPGQIVPADSEHSALAQCLRAGRLDEVAKLILTASGGPFRGRPRTELADVTPEQALAHPTWAMGPVVTVNCATMINKGLELIEAHLLFDVPYDRIDVVIHPQSIVHSMVQFTDGSTIAQANPPDMRLPLALALAWPERVPDAVPPCDWTTAMSWEFEPVDDEAFPAVSLARAAGVRGGAAPAVYNAANEECVSRFLAGSLPFPAIVDTVSSVLDEYAGGNPSTLDEVLETDAWARTRARELMGATGRGGNSA